MVVQDMRCHIFSGRHGAIMWVSVQASQVTRTWFLFNKSVMFRGLILMGLCNLVQIPPQNLYQVNLIGTVQSGDWWVLGEVQTLLSDIIVSYLFSPSHCHLAWFICIDILFHCFICETHSWFSPKPPSPTRFASGDRLLYVSSSYYMTDSTRHMTEATLATFRVRETLYSCIHMKNSKGTVFTHWGNVVYISELTHEDLLS